MSGRLRTERTPKRRNAIAERKARAAADKKYRSNLHCRKCGAIVRVADDGRPRRFCSDRCRWAAAKKSAAKRYLATTLQGGTKPSLTPLKTKANFSGSGMPIDLVGGRWRGRIDPTLRRAILDSELRLIPMPLTRA